MKRLVGFVFGLVLLSGCAGERSPHFTTTHEQEGIGGDLAAFYAKSVTAASLHARINDEPEQFDDVEAELRRTPVFSYAGLPLLVMRKGDALWVDRNRIRTAHVCDISRAYLHALGEYKNNRDICYRVDSAVEKKRGNALSPAAVLKSLSLYEPHRFSGGRFIRSPFTFDLALGAIPGMSEALEMTKMSFDHQAVYDRANGSRKGPEIVRVDTIANRSQKNIKVDQSRIDEVPELAPFIAIFMLHELNHIAYPQELPDRSYALSQELFTMWLDL